MIKRLSLADFKKAAKGMLFPEDYGNDEEFVAHVSKQIDDAKDIMDLCVVFDNNEIGSFDSFLTLLYSIADDETRRVIWKSGFFS